jgi:hypothetical protein
MGVAASNNNFLALWRYQTSTSLASETGSGGQFDGLGTKYTHYAAGAVSCGILLATSVAEQNITSEAIPVDPTLGFSAAVRLSPHSSAAVAGYRVLLLNTAGTTVGVLEFKTGETMRYVRVLNAAGAELAKDVTLESTAAAKYNTGWYTNNDTNSYN